MHRSRYITFCFELAYKKVQSDTIITGIPLMAKSASNCDLEQQMKLQLRYRISMHAVEGADVGSASGGFAYDGKIAGLYDLEETLGSGHFAVVKLARHVFTGAKVAVKVVDKAKLDEVSKAHLFQEVRCMKLVQHPNVVRLYEVIDTQTKLYLVLELGDGGDLYDYIMKHERGLNEEIAKKYFRQIVRAIAYCHQLHVVHRDLKPENVIFFEKLGVVKLTDFGFSNKFSPGQKLATSCGSLAYSAPEILLGDSYDAPAVDIWSLGVILYMLVCGQPPFEKANDSETLTMIMDCKYTMPSHITADCRNLIASMLVRDPEKRATLEQIAKASWLQQKNTASDTMTEYHLPLVSRQELSEEDHAFIIQKMINGKIASKEEIMKALDKNQYSHITATYFLLGEIRLKKHWEEQVRRGRTTLQVQKVVPRQLVKKERSTLIVPLEAESKNIFVDSVQVKRTRKCSIVREEDEDESMCEYSLDKYELKVAATRRESISDGRLSETVQEHKHCVADEVIHNNNNKRTSKMSISVTSALVEKLDNIQNTAEDGEEDDIVILPNLHSSRDEKLKLSSGILMDGALCGMKALKINKLKHLSLSNKNPILNQRKTKLNRIRTPNCSSSETSDDDTKARNKKKLSKPVCDMPPLFRMDRRDSHDDSSDSQDQTTLPSSSAQYNTGHFLKSGSSNSKESKGEQQQQNKEKSKTESRKTSANPHSRQKRQHMRDKQSFTYNFAYTNNSGQRRRLRQSQSLDRITEAQEYEQRYLSPICNLRTEDTDQNQHKKLSQNFNSLFVSGSIEEGYCHDEETTLHGNNEILAARNRRHSGSDFWDDQIPRSSFDEIDLVVCVNGLTKVIQLTGYKCSITIKKIQEFRKCFSGVNFS